MTHRPEFSSSITANQMVVETKKGATKEVVVTMAALAHQKPYLVLMVLTKTEVGLAEYRELQEMEAAIVRCPASVE